MASGKVKIILGDMFQARGDVFVIPRSEDGSMIFSFQRGLKNAFNIDYQPDSLKRKLGDIEIVNKLNIKNYHTNDIKNLEIIYATCQGTASQISIIDTLALKICEFVNDKRDIKVVVLPLLGTGKGGFGPLGVYQALKQQFIKSSRNDCRFEIYTLNSSIYKTLEAADEVDDPGVADNPLYPDFIIESKIAGLTNDAYEGDPILEIKKDVTAFAKIISSKSFRPPLAIVLFGKWGAGKSFFMEKLKAQVTDFSSLQNSAIYCEGIAQIHFNAWSYLDANLWASIVTRIFEELNTYIGNNAVDKSIKKEITETLTEKLALTNEELIKINNRKNKLADELKKLNQEKAEINKELKKKIGQIREISFNAVIDQINKDFDASQYIKAALRENESIIKTEDDLKEILPEKYWSSPDESYKKISSIGTFFKEFFNKRKIWKNLLFMILIVCFVLVVPSLLEIFHFSLAHYSFATNIIQVILSFLTVGSFTVGRIINTYRKLQPTIAAFWQIKEDYNSKIQAAKYTNEQNEKALRLDIEQKNLEILSTEQRIQKAQSDLDELKFKKEHGLATEALYSFIEKRYKSDEYQKQLGIVSIIRKDFETLSKLFVEHQEEADVAKFRAQFKKPLKRIILYVDDLDRCPEDRVVEVLEAVNLLMAFQLFVVVVGVDPRWVKNALLNRYRSQFRNLGEQYATEYKYIEPSDYLEKIFQVPFHLKTASDVDVKAMIRKLSEAADLPAPVPIESRNTISNDTNQDALPVSPNSITETSNEIKTGNNNQSDELVGIERQDEGGLILPEPEIALLTQMSIIIGSNPRAIKRFVNIYRIIRAHEDVSNLVQEIKDKDIDCLVIMFLLALSIGQYKKLNHYFLNYMALSEYESKPLSRFLNDADVTCPEDLILLRVELNHALSGDSYNILKNESIKRFKHHNQFVRRFTFDEMI